MSGIEIQKLSLQQKYRLQTDDLTINNRGQLKAILKPYNYEKEPHLSWTKLGYLNDVCAGCIITRLEDTSLYIDWIAVLPHYQKHGLGKKLVEWAQEYCKDKGMELRVIATEDTSKWFQEIGFVPENERDAWFGKGIQLVYAQ
ncbi:hypothetical protein EDD86DRAFT_248025 [Gorgonomyces haynaldii]|nr:hypothetical protein EDD86DRAFT_248025 [Gorgonomyces haynaldii]